MTVTLGDVTARNASAWTVITNPANVFYVSDSQGHDNNNGLVTTANPSNTGGAGAPGPFKTLGKAGDAMAALTNGTSRWILLRRGDTFTDQSLTSQPHGFNEDYGESDQRPLVWASYDEAFPINTSTGANLNPVGSSRARPIVGNAEDFGAYTTGGGTFTSGGDYVAIMGLDFYNRYSDPNSGSFTGNAARTLVGNGNPVHWTLIEDCRFRFGAMATDGRSGKYSRFNMLHDCPQQGFHGGGGFTPEGWVVEGNVIARCGEKDAVFDHNLYMDGVERKGELTTRHGQMVLRNNVLFRGGTSNQLRSGYLVNNNSYVNQNGGQNVGCPFVGVDNFVTNNVWTELNSIALPTPPAGFNLTGGFLSNAFEALVYDNASQYNVGNLTISGNICANSIATTGQGFWGDPGANHITYDNNIFYKWMTSSSQPDNTIHNYSGAIAPGGLTITNAGSLYDPLTSNISAVSREATGINNVPIGNCVILTVANVDALNANRTAVGAGATSVYISGITTGNSSFRTAMNGQVFKCAILDYAAKQIVLFNTESFPAAGSVTDGAIYSPYYGQALHTLTGSGNSAKVDIIVGPSGTVVGLDYEGSEGTPLGNIKNLAGVLYAAGDTLNSTAFDTAATGSGMVLTVNTIASVTITGASLSVNGSTGLITPSGGTNIFDPAGSNPGAFLDPTRTAAKYRNYLRSTTGSTAEQFVNDCLTQSKASFDFLYTAASLNDYIRQGFGMSMLGSAYADGVSPGTPPVLMAQICM